MDRYKSIFVFLSLLSYISCDISYEKKNKLVNGFIDFYNSLPNQIYSCDEGYLQNAQQSTEQNSYEIEVTLKVSDHHNLDSTKNLRCTGKVVDLDEVGVSVLNHHCEDVTSDDKGSEIEEVVVTETSSDAAEPIFERKPIQLDNEVQTNTAVTSGEQFIAVPREEQKVHCIGCGSHVNPQAPGVSELAAIGVRQLNSLEPNIQHTLNTIVDVERQVQVVNGIRYILTLVIDYNSCLTANTETCLDSKTCKITFLEKPWMQFPDGSKYRAVLSNNCTEEWRFGDNGVVIPNAPTDSREKNNINTPETDGSDIIKPVHNVDVQAQLHTDKTLTDDDIKVIQNQIIPYSQFNNHGSEPALTGTSEPTKTSEPGKEHVVKVEQVSQFSPNAIPESNINPIKIENLSEDKKKAIDDMLNFFNFAGFDSAQPNTDKTRMKRSYDSDLNIMNLVEKFHKVKKNVENAKYIYKLAQIVVDYLNEIDLEVKTRVLKDVINAEEESENHQHFYYIQSHVVIPCDKSECEAKDTITKICNAVLDGTDKHVQILNVFCHDEPKAKPFGKINSVALDDPVLLMMIKKATNKIESESSFGKAMKINKVIDANTQRVSGTLTKFSIVLDLTNCEKTVPLIFRSNCTVVEELGSQICDVTVHERHWLKESKITYTCSERPVDTSFSSKRKAGIKKSVNDPAVLDMVNEALQYLDVQSNRNNKQVVVKVNSVATQLVAGFLTDIEFVVGYTTCTNDVKHDTNNCKLLKDEPLRTCKAKVWDRTWIEDGRQVEVSCKDPNIEGIELSKKVKRDSTPKVLVGAPSNKDVEDPQFIMLAKEALRKYLQSSVYNRHFEVVNVLEVSVQVVAGTLTRLKYDISPTTCLIDKEGNPSSSDCKIFDENDITTCDSRIWEKPWLDFKEINTTCQVNKENARDRRGATGVSKEENINEPRFLKLAEESMHKYLQDSGNSEPHRLVRIERVTTQVVSGKKTIIDFKIMPTAKRTGDTISCTSDIWEQPWSDLKKIKVNCNINNQFRTKREVNHESYTARRLLSLGEERTQDVDNPEFKLLAKESLQKFFQSSGSDQHYKLISIEKVTVQKVSGILTKLEFNISPTDCQLDADGNPSSSECKVIDVDDVIRCSSEILEQKWQNSKNIDVTCHVDDALNRVKRDMVGKSKHEDPNDPKYKKLAEESMHKYLQSTGKTHTHEVFSVDTVTTQVVAGTLTTIDFTIAPTGQTTGDNIRCNSEIWEQPWLNKKDINVNCGIDNHSRTKRQTLGSVSQKDPNDPKYKKLAEESMHKYLQSTGKTHTHEVFSVDAVTTKVVAGTLTTIDFTIAPTGQTTGDNIRCNSEIWEQPWLNKKDINVNCGIDNHSRTKRQTLGSVSQKDPNDPKYKKLAEESMHKYLQSTGKTHTHEVFSVDAVTTKVVAGTLTTIDFTIAPTGQTTGDNIRCNSEIWEQPWLNKKDINVNCGIDNHSRTKRQTLGSVSQKNPNDPKYKKLAEESMHKYLQSTGKTHTHEVFSVDAVTTKVVAGTLTTIDFTIAPTGQTTGDNIRCNSEIWEQPWLNKKDINVNCGIDNHSRTKRQTLGSVSQKNPNDPKYKKLAEESMQKYLQSTGKTHTHEVFSVDAVTTKVVAGTLTTIDFTIAPTGQTTGDNIRCNSEIWEQPWLNKKDINVNCGIDNHSRTKRQTLGSVSQKNPNDPKYKKLAEESMHKYLQSTGKTHTHEVFSVDAVTTKVVAGTLTTIDFTIAPTGQTTGDNIRCNSEIWEQPWLNKKDINVNCGIDNHSRTKRQTLGSVSQKNPNDPKYKKLAEESMHKYLQSTGKTHTHEVFSVDAVTTKVVAGTLTTIDFTIAPTGQTTGDNIRCNSEIWEQPWLNKKDINVNCGIDNHSRTKRQTLGSVSQKNPNDPKYKKLAEESMHKYLQSTGKTHTHEVFSVDAVTTKVVAGTLTTIDFTIAPTGQTTGDTIRCNSEIWEQPWLNKKDINVNCGIDNHSRTKRQTLGSVSQKNPNDPKYKKLAEESMHKYLQSTGKTHTHEVFSVDAVTTKVVAGTLTTIDFTIAPTGQTTGDNIRCNSEIWEQPWLNKKDINVNCGIDNHSRTKRQTLGSVSQKNPNDPKYKKLAEESMHKYLQSTGKTHTHEVFSVDAVTTKVVAGTLTTIDFTIAPTGQTTGDNIRCNSEIWEQPWLNKKDINVNCGIDNHSRTKRQTLGSVSQKNPNDPKYKKLAEESMHKYLQSTGKTHTHEVFSVDAVTTKVVAGTLTTIDFTIAPTGQTTGDTIRCNSEIWEQPWLNKKDINVNCGIDNHSRAKREIFHTPNSEKRNLIGGKRDQDPTKIEYKELAQASLKQYLKLQKNSYLHNIVEVKKVTTKVVSGIIYNIEYIAAPKYCADDISTCVDSKSVLHCDAEVWDRPWLGNKSIKVLCKANNNKKMKSRSLELKDIEDRRHEQGHREKRQTRADDEYVDEDISFYYADRAIKQLNDQSNSNNLHKLITIHGSQNSIHMDQPMVRMYIETAETYCLRHRDESVLPDCDELDGMNHQLCLARLWPSPDDELVIKQVSLVCDDDEKFESISGLSISALIKASIKEVEKSPKSKYKLVHQGEPQVIPTLDSNRPITINFIVASTNCSKNIDVDLNIENNYNCFIDISRPSKACQSRIWFAPNSKTIKKIFAKCGTPESRKKRSVSLNPSNSTADELIIRNMVQESLHKLEMSSSNRYKQRVLQINSYSTKITSGKVTTIDFDVAYTSCLKFEWVEDVKSCEFLEHLPRRHCVSQVWERLWVQNGRNIEVTCEEDETPLEAHIEFESAETAKKLADEALKHIEAKYPHPRKQKVVRIFSLEKQVVAGIHYRMKIEVGSTQCSALSAETGCKLDKDIADNKFCRVNVWLRPWTNHAPNFRVSCDYQEAATTDLYHHLQAEQLFHEFMTTYKPEYINNPNEMKTKFKIFKANIRKIHELNIHEKGTATYGVTRFADLSYEEFSAKFLGLKPSLRGANQVPMRQADIPNLHIPDKFDWRDYDAVTEVKNQGSCGSCWAFSVTGNIEGQWKMQSGQLVSLSEQELVDCDKLDQGCNGGLPDNAYRAIEQLGGLELEKDYPYEGEDDKCSFNNTMSRVKISGAVNITTNETGMAKWLVQNGPISIGINANAMQFYMGGVSHPWKMLCNPTNLDHGVLIVGYGIKDYPLFHKRLPFWTIKNSWGPEWGEQGYYRVYRGDGTCGVNQMASSALI